MTSAYPITVDELTDRVREHAARIGGWPSARQVMTEFRVGRPKAATALDALRADGFDPTTTDHGTECDPADPAEARPVALHVVPTPTDRPSGDRSDVVPDVDDTATAPFPPVSGAVDAPAVPAVTTPGDRPGVRARLGSWPLVLIALGAFVSIWGGWVGLGELTGFGPIRLLPGIADQVVINSAITLPIGVEAYAAFALRVWLAPSAGLTEAARRFARWSAIGSLALGAAGQIAYHLMVAAGMTAAPWQITAFVSCLPVVVLGCGAALTHLTHQTEHDTDNDGEATR